MTDKEKIRAEIERLIEELQPCNTRENLRAHGAIAGYYQILSFINSMQEEPVSDDLLVAANKAWLKSEDKESYAETFIDGFVACFNWQKRKDSISSKDLEELINTLSKRYPEVSFAKLSRIAVRVAQWQKARNQETIETAIHHAYHNGRLEMKEQMMKDATDVTVHVDAGGYPYIPQMELYDYDNDVPLAKEGDKYKVVLIKED